MLPKNTPKTLNLRQMIEEQNIKTGSIDWRGNHELSTIYSDEYYLSKPKEWKAIFEKDIIINNIEVKHNLIIK